MAAAATPTSAGWGRRRLLGTLVTVIAVAALLLGGLIYALLVTIGAIESNPDTDPGDGAVSTDTQAAGGTARRNQIAAAPMLPVPGDAMFPAAVDQDAPEPIEVPAGQLLGPAEVITGFPRTAEGAIGQLAQLDLTALQAMGVPTAREVYRAWALPGGIGPDRWAITRSVRAFLTSSSLGEPSGPPAWVQVQPAAALVKGADGPDWVTACVLLKVTGGYRSEGQVGFGHCERMQWVGGRWMVAPGLPPAPAPSTWPGTTLANQAGWRPWITTD